MGKPDYIVSDTHLGAVPPETERQLLKFLDHVGGHGASLVINGDLFDFWFEWGPVIPARHFRVLAALSALVDASIPVTMIGGNHDAWGGDFLKDDVGVLVHQGCLKTRLGDRSALIAHGDGLGKGDLKYRLLKSVLRSKAAIWGFRALHPEIGVKIANRVSHTRQNIHRQSTSRAAFLESWAREQFSLDPGLELIACGHSHVPALVEVAPGKHYVNSGDWVRNRTYCTVAAGLAPELKSWT